MQLMQTTLRNIKDFIASDQSLQSRQSSSSPCTSNTGEKDSSEQEEINVLSCGAKDEGKSDDRNLIP